MAEKDSPEYPPAIVSRFFRGFAWVASKVLWSIKYHGMENIPRKDAFAYIIASNHQAYFDPAWVGAPIHQKMNFMAWGEVFEWKFIGPMIRLLGAFPVFLGGAKALASVKRALKILRDGGVLVIFPEGERAFGDGKLLEFKEGVAGIAIRAQAPILPATIKGGNRVWPQGQKWPHLFSRVEITYHPLIYPPKSADNDADAKLCAELEGVIGNTLEG